MTTTTPDMGLILPDVSVTAGPQWATLLNAAFSTVDSHNHATGNGVQVTPSGLNISSDLTFLQNNATNLRSLRLFNNTSFTAGGSDLTCLYALNNELYYRDGAGNTVQITLGGFIDVSGSISSLTIKDTNFFIENFSDTTKQFRFNTSAIPTGTTRVLSVPDSGANDTFVTQAATQTLTNKTLSGNTAATLISGSGTLNLNTSGTITIPNATDTVVILAATQTLTNKTLTTPTILEINTGTPTFTLPTADGTSGQVLQTNGSAVLSFGNIPAAPNANVAANDSNVVFTSASNRVQICTPTAPRTYKLPTTGILAGDTWTFVNQSTTDANIITIQSSGSNTIDYCIADSTITLVSLVATPTTAANWLVLDAHSGIISYTPILGTGFGTTSNVKFTYSRKRNMMSINGYFTTGTVASAAGTVSLGGGFNLDTTLFSSGANSRVNLGIFTRIANGTSGLFTVNLGGLWTYDGTNAGSIRQATVEGSSQTSFGLDNPVSTITSGDSVLVYCQNIPISGWH